MQNAAIEIDGLSKRYGATIALDDVTFSIHRGAVHALLGENGAGKSTIVKLLSGLVRADTGSIRLFGNTARLLSAAHAHAAGIQTAFQEILLVPDLTVAENMFLPRSSAGGIGLFQQRRMERVAGEHLERLGVLVDPRREVRELDLPSKQKIAIARAVSRDPQILLLDEPTSALSENDVQWLGEIIARLQARGVTIIFVTHRMLEVRRYCDRLTVLRNGRHVGTNPVADVSDSEIVRLVIGRSISAAFPEKADLTEAYSGRPLLAVEGLGTESRLDDVSFELYGKEIVGIAALEGMGQRELFLSLFGMLPSARGGMRLYDQPVILSSPKEAVRAGVSLVPEDRKNEGLFWELTGRENVSLASLRRYSRWGYISPDREAREVDAVLQRLQIHPRALYTSVSAFSGGNQQKFVIAKWLLANTRIFLMFDPTRGVDVGTKQEIYVLMREFARMGGGVLFYSTEIPEIVHLCDRVLVLYQGRIVREMAGGDINEEQIMSAALGSDHQEVDAATLQVVADERQ